MRRLISGFLLISVMVFIFAGCGGTDKPAANSNDDVETPAETFTWRLQCAYGEADIEYIALEPWVEAIKERTNGRLIINTFPGGTIVPEDQQLEAVARGAIDVSHAMGGYWRGTVPVGDIDLGLPGQYPGFRSLDLVMNMLYEFEDGRLSEIFREAYREQAGVYYLGSHSYHGYPVIISTVPIQSIDDLRGLIIRVTGAYADLFEELGASTTFVPGGEMYTELQLGTIDAATWSIEGFLGYSWYEVAPYLMSPTISDHNCSNMLINPDSWEALPDDIKAIVEETYHEVFMPTLFQIYEDEWDRVVEKQEELGYEIVQIPEETIEEIKTIAREKIWPKIANKDEYTRQAMDLIERWYEAN